jgi:repressor LexA
MTPDDCHLAALRTYWKRHNAFPAMAKLCEVLWLASTSSVFAAVGRLTEAGYLERVEGRIAPTKRFFARPVLGSVRAGLPQPASQEATEVLTLDDFLIDDPNRTSLHRVRGESMRDVVIMEVDLVVVEHNTPTKPGDIVVACVERTDSQDSALGRTGQLLPRGGERSSRESRRRISMKNRSIGRSVAFRSSAAKWSLSKSPESVK